MYKAVLALTCLFLISCSPQPKSTKTASTAPRPVSSAPQPGWKLPAQSPTGPEADQIRYGQELIEHTARYLGPEAKDPGLRLTGNHMSCKNCHLQAGKQANALGYVGITARYPQFRARENRKIQLSERINGCMERSLNGKPLPENSLEMQAMLAYMRWLSQDIPTGQTISGQGLPKLALLERAANPTHGQQVFAKNCTVCHQPNGQGVLVQPGKPAEGYTFPPLWGKDSFNSGAGMHRLLTAARYIKANMPFGQAHLSIEEAYDVAAFINSQYRPIKSDLAGDYPDLKHKPVDAPFPPFGDTFALKQHQYGPFGPILKAQGKTEP